MQTHPQQHLAALSYNGSDGGQCILQLQDKFSVNPRGNPGGLATVTIVNVMTYKKSLLLAKSLALDSARADQHALMIERVELVRTFNQLRGAPAGTLAVMQNDFIEGILR